MNELLLRPAVAADLVVINDIYNHYVQTSTCTYQEDLESYDDRLAWFASHAPGHAVIVAEADGRVVGWGSISPFRERSGYRFTVEDSVYVHHHHHGRGIGSHLLARLIELARQGGYRSIMAGIDAEQQPSIALHRKFGFTVCADLKQVGFKFGRWLDVVYMQLMLDGAITSAQTCTMPQSS